MKSSLVVSLLLLLLSHLIFQSQGIRLDKGSSMSVEQKIMKDVMKTSSKGDDEVIVCKEGEECNSEAAGNTRKLITNININASTSTSTNIPKVHKNEHVGGSNGNPTASTVKTTARGFGGQEELLHVNIPATSSSEQYPEIVDIAEMDYSPARRKPPIHN